MRDQDELRKIMATPRGERQPLEAPKPKAVMAPPPGKKKSGKKPSAAYVHKMAMDKRKEAHESGISDAYRDRAAERRKDANPDYRPEDLRLADQLAQRYDEGGTCVVVGESKSKEELEKEIEQSKFLGGDMEHTHLVKGLDYALLKKTRSELNKETKKERKARQMMEMIAASQKITSPLNAEPDDKPGRVQSKHGGFETHMGRMVHGVLFGDKVSAGQKTHAWLPGRMALEFSLEADFSDDIPTTITRSKSDCPKYALRQSCALPGAVAEKVLQTMHFLRLGKDGKRLKRKLKLGEESREESRAMPPPPPPMPGAGPMRDSDEDIFDGIGKDYVCEVADKQGEQAQPHGTNAGYFGAKPLGLSLIHI
eukprot:TRINITY_DN21937_c0_g1_i3.p1 TRINITY_DN21937_c0_g1~~TRINITY_DN21937_c0_g1_i3.p1  ORF type:complete len:367 (-),score=85.01 TRINITY_DN21937_c0_g1_i3:158-1258(-)